MAKAWVTVADSLEYSGMNSLGANNALKAVAPALTSLPRAETAFNQVIANDGAHKDPVFYIKDFLISHYEITGDTRMVQGVTIDKLRNLLADRGTEESLIKDSGFNAAAQQATASRARKIDQIHEELVGMLPDLLIKDSDGKLIRATEEVIVPRVKKGEAGHVVQGADGEPHHTPSLGPRVSRRGGVGRCLPGRLRPRRTRRAPHGRRRRRWCGRTCWSRVPPARQARHPNAASVRGRGGGVRLRGPAP